MTSERRLETRLHSIIGDIARGPYPDYIDDVLAGTARRRQRPAWTFPERWLPMDIAAQPLQVTRRVPSWAVVVVALLLMALVGALALSTGSGPRLPPAYGRASNGLVAFGYGGDIQTVDPVTGTVTALITGPASDRGPVYSRDGTKLVFFRDPGTLLVARSDGTGLVAVTPDTLQALEGWSFSPDGRFVIAIAEVAGSYQVLIVPSDGSAAPRFLDLSSTGVGSPPQYRPDGSEILFVGAPNGAEFRGVHAVNPMNGVIRTIVQGSASAEAQAASWSPDGRRVAFASDQPDGSSLRMKNVSGAGPEEVLVKRRGYPTDWSHDGRYLLFTVDAGANGRDVWVYDFQTRSPRPLVSSPVNEYGAVFSPDGKWVAYVADQQIYIRSFTDAGTGIPVTSGGGMQPSWNKNGRELFFLSPDTTLMAAEVKMTGTTLTTGSVGEPKPLFRIDVNPARVIRNQYVVTPDGQRVMVLAPVIPTKASPLIGISNWMSALAGIKR